MLGNTEYLIVYSYVFEVLIDDEIVVKEKAEFKRSEALIGLNTRFEEV